MARLQSGPPLLQPKARKSLAPAEQVQEAEVHRATVMALRPRRSTRLQPCLRVPRKMQYTAVRLRCELVASTLSSQTWRGPAYTSGYGHVCRPGAGDRTPKPHPAFARLGPQGCQARALLVQCQPWQIRPRTPVACSALGAAPLLVRVVDVDCPMSLCQLCERLDWATAQQFRPLKGSALGAPARTDDAGGVPASTEHPFELEGLGRYRSPNPAAAKLLARQRGSSTACRATATQPAIKPDCGA